VDTCHLDVRFQEPVIALVRQDDGRFLVTSRTSTGLVGRRAPAVVLATGAYDFPNRIGVPGEDLPHVSHFYREPHPYFRRRVVIVGGKNSAAEAALDLYRNGAHVTLVHRGAALGESIKYWVKPDIENRIKAGSIAARFSTRVIRITSDAVCVEGPDGPMDVAADGVLLMTGYHSDTTLLASAGADIDAVSGAPVHHAETFETTVPNLFVAGAFIAGQQSGRIFIENGRFHGEVVINEIAKRLTR
jgi:thioredoxin reductase (NADPH)